MYYFGLILPAGLALVSIFQIIVFVIVAIILPGTLIALMLNSFGVSKKGQHVRINNQLLLRKVSGIILYHAAMLSIWIVSWPQFTNDIHSGYDLSLGLIYYLVVMLFWTATGLLLIYGWNLLQNKNVKWPGLGFFVRLYLWNLLVMLIFRQIIFWHVTN